MALSKMSRTTQVLLSGALALMMFVGGLLVVSDSASAGSCSPIGATKNHQYGCCGINNYWHSWQKCTSSGWVYQGGCDYSNCCAYPCAV